MVAGKLLVRARYPGTGSVRLLLVGRLIRRERSAARATTNTTSSADRARRETTAIVFTNFFTSGGPREVSTIRSAGRANGKALTHPPRSAWDQGAAICRRFRSASRQAGTPDQPSRTSQKLTAAERSESGLGSRGDPPTPG